jgi:nitrite reductase (cytochrome c-552)
MSETTDRPWPRRLLYLATVVVTAAVTFGIVALLMNIRDRKEEGRQHYLKLVELDEDTIDPAVWGKNFPRQYDGYLRTAEETPRTRYGGSETISKLDDKWKRFFAGYAFSIEYREERGHAYMLEDQDKTERTHQVKQPGACLHCHASIIPAYRKAGGGDVMKGFAEVCAMPLAEARKLVGHPVSCLDCHDPETMQIRATRPGFLNGMKELARSDSPVPHLPSVERWRQGKRDRDYDVNALATRQEMRSFVCGQCHVEYYFKGEGKLLTYPWHKGLKADQIEGYYDAEQFRDWVHPETGAPILKAQHPEFELWNQGIHARSGVACADCHMPYKREGAMKVSDHWVRSPLLNPSRSCQTCHPYSESEIQARVEAIQDRTHKLLDRSAAALTDMLDAIGDAKKRGAADAALTGVYELHRKAQWRLDFVAAENSMGFHAPQEAARILAEAIDYARQGQVSALRQ